MLNVEMKAEENKTLSKNRWLVIVLIRPLGSTATIIWMR